MRHLYFTLFALVFSFNTFAVLDPSQQKLADLALSGDLQQLKTAAKSINGNNISEPALLDILAEILLKKYPNALSSEIDTLAWVARAIGSSENGRYHSILSEVVNSSGQKKLIRHAKKALKELGDAEGEQYTAGMYQLPAKLYARESDSARDKRILALLMAGDLSSLKQGARSVVDTSAQTQLLTDTIAEVLISYHADASDGKIETFSWLATALGQSASGRYVDVLAEVKENGSHRKLRKYAKKALETHGEAKGEQYQKGMLGKAIPSYDF